ncbi:uncharacterized protein BO88DRAFT_435893 [Aspergillus vadensis CBS 113365]|uniref:Uncharacterized protein n=1 Tax=Aspergillus vadensis (strain CBS 113365 / IMI 142717 / IBT 24658) TaxID=1448311 RepID=A0A319B712_ASPVC|nr:hypothetical protein BO88DRAFT_435893 [Aspergillus vadensis CBS 113365]PYH68577.1 hypothetical protein BO88DRAFT_435893 [Aspergillus vadensis CBS 113365]
MPGLGMLQDCFFPCWVVQDFGECVILDCCGYGYGIESVMPVKVLVIVYIPVPTRKQRTASYYLVVLDVITTLLEDAEIPSTVSVYLLVNPLQCLGTYHYQDNVPLVDIAVDLVQLLRFGLIASS